MFSESRMNDKPLLQVTDHGTSKFKYYTTGFITKVPNQVEIIHSAHHLPGHCTRLCPQWDYQQDRYYFHVLEHGYEHNSPFIEPTYLQYLETACGCCCCGAFTMLSICFRYGLLDWIPPNRCCPSRDAAEKIYFDRNVFDRQSILFADYGGVSIVSGPPTIYSGPSNYVCCFQDCPMYMNECLEGRVSCLCGDHVSIRPFVTFCDCPLESFWLTNCFGMCGKKDGEPLCVISVPGAHCLQVGEGEKLAAALNDAYSSWSARVTEVMKSA